MCLFSTSQIARLVPGEWLHRAFKPSLSHRGSRLRCNYSSRADVPPLLVTLKPCYIMSSAPHDQRAADIQAMFKQARCRDRGWGLCFIHKQVT